MASIHQTEFGTWRVVWRDPRGRSQSKTFPLNQQARDWVIEVEGRKRHGTYTPPAAGRTKFGDWAKVVMRRRRKIRDSTRARDESYLRSLVLPTFGDLPLDSVDPHEVEMWVSSMEETHAPATVRKAYQLAALVFKAAVTADMIGRSPCRGVDLPPLPHREMRFLDSDELTALVDAIGRDRALVLTAAYTGLRWGELAALEVGADGLDLLRRRIRVTRILTEVSGRLKVGPPKTNASKRTVILPRFLVDELAYHLEDGAKPRVFAAPDGGALRRTNWQPRTWIPAVRASVGLPLRFHDLRHTHAAMLIAQGTHPKVIQARLGHASITTTLNTYGHLFDGLDEEAADNLDDFAGSHVADLLQMDPREG